jgi:hypothetical protein
MGWNRQIEFRGIVTGEKDQEMSLELIVTKATVESHLGTLESKSEFIRSRGQRDTLTGQEEDTDPDWSRTYNVRMSRNGKLVNWEGKLGALELLRGLGADFYNAFTSLLTDMPKHVVRVGEEWMVSTGVKPAHCETIAIDLACRFEGLEYRDGLPGYRIAATLSLPEKQAPILKGARLTEIQAVWWFSSDLRAIFGTVRFSVELEGGAKAVQWFDSVEVRPIP